MSLHISELLSSCAVMDITGVSSISDEGIHLLLTSFVYEGRGWGNDYAEFNPGVYIFVDKIKHPAGRRSIYSGNAINLAREIKKRKVGKLLETKAFKNTNGNTCKAWLWDLRQKDITKAKKDYEKQEQQKTKRRRN